MGVEGYAVFEASVDVVVLNIAAAGGFARQNQPEFAVVAPATVVPQVQDRKRRGDGPVLRMFDKLT